MASSIRRIFKKLDTLEKGQADIRERVTRVEGKIDTVEQRQENHYERNQKEHNDLVSLISDPQSQLDERKGERRILGRGWELLIAFIAGGGFMALIGIIAKFLKMISSDGRGKWRDG